ncbi:MAG: right-handed parallel beta-helix repeat-containing protein [Myxococcota bacterium]
MSPNNILWVDNGASGTGSGTPGTPYNSLEAALEAAPGRYSPEDPGLAIMLIGGHSAYGRIDLGDYTGIDFNLAIIGRSIRPQFQILDEVESSPYTISTSYNNKLYLSSIDITNSTEPGAYCQGGPESGLWLDNMTITETTGGAVVANSCPLSIHKSIIYNNVGPGIRITGNSSLHIESSLITNNSDTGVRAENSSNIDLTYSTIVNNPTSNITCSSDITGAIRNSIIINPSSISDNIDCQNITATADDGNVANATINKEEVSFIDLRSWFLNIEHGDLHLSDTGQMFFKDKATWNIGDSLYDVDGDPRPGIDGGPTYPGADE